MISYLVEHNRYLNIIGIITILSIAFLFSRNRRAINYRLIINALLFEFVLAFCILRTSLGYNVINVIAQGIDKLYQFAEKGSQFVFGNLIATNQAWGFIFAFKVLPIIIFFGALMSALFYLGIIPRCVSAISIVIRPLLGTSGAETLCAIANSFLGQTEAPLLIRGYLAGMTRSEIFVVMVSGMGTISGAILAVFAAMGVPAIHLLTASVMAIPGTILIAKIIYPETETTETGGQTQASVTSPAKNVIDAVSMGTSDGLHLALNVGAMLISFISLIALLNAVLGFGAHQLNNLFAWVDFSFRLPDMSLNYLFSYLFAPFGYLLGFSGQQALQAGQLLGLKVTINELIAYGEMTAMQLPERFIAIMTYALCGFSNFSCIGIQIGGIGSLVPEKRVWLSQLGLLAVLASSLSNLLSAMIVGLLI